VDVNVSLKTVVLDHGVRNSN